MHQLSALWEKSGGFMPKKALEQRVSVSLDTDTYENLSKIAAQNNVSIAWVMRYAIQNLLRDKVVEKHQQLILPLENSFIER